MPKQVYVESRDQTIEVPDDFTPEEIQNAIAASFSEGQDIAFDLKKFQEAGGNTKDFIEGISDEDYIKLNNFRSDKKMTTAEMGGIVLDAAGTLVKDVLKGAYAAGKTMVEAPAKGDNLATAKVVSSAARGIGAGTIDLAQLGLTLLSPTKRIPTFDEFEKQPVIGYGYAYGPAPSLTSKAATPEDYKNLIDSERKKELAALEMVDVADKLVKGASIEDVAKGARFIDAFTITGLAKSLAKGVGKGIAKKGFYEATTGIHTAGAAAPGKVAQAAAKAAEVLGKAPAAAAFAGAKAAEAASIGLKWPIDVAGKLIENEVVRGALGAGIGYSQGDIKGAVTGLTAATVGTKVASKLLEGTIAGSQFIGAAAKGALNSASRTGFVEQILKNPKVSPSVRNIANALLPLQPAFQFAGQVAKETAKDFLPAAGIGAGLGYMAGGKEGAAAGIGSALGVAAMTGPIKASVSAVRTLAKAPTARGDANALGDIKTFVNAIPDEKSRIQYAQIMDQAIKVAGPERAADMLDALRLAEAHGATVVVGPKDSPNSFSSIGNIISVNPSKLNSGTVFHETVHQLLNVGVRASLLPELRNLYDGIRDADGNILKPGLYTEADWAAKAKELAESYKNNPIGYKMSLDYANKLENPAGYSPEAIQEAKDFVLDEATAIYTERLMGRSRPGAFNPDRLPMWHRNLLDQIDQRVLDRLATELYTGQTNLNTPSKAFTDANGRPVRIPQLDVILRKAFSGKYPKSGDAAPKQAAPKTVPIPKNPVDVAKFAQATFGATRDILGTDENGNPRLLTEKEHQAVAKADYEAAVQAFQQLSPDDQATVRVVNRKGEPVSITDKDSQIQITSATPEPVFERFLQVARDRGMGNQQLATMRQLYASMVSPEGPTFDTVNNPVWKYSKRTGQMESTVRPPTRQEIYPLFIHVNSAGGFNVKYIDLSRLKQNAQKIMSDPKHQGVWPSMDAFMDDFKRSMRNLSAEGKQPDTPSGSKSTAELLGNGDENLGAVKRDLIAEALNVTLPERLKSKGYENEPVFEPLSLIGKEKRGKRIGESAFRDFRIERVTEITPTTERLKVVQENAYDKLVQRFQPDSFTPETLPNGEAWTNPDGYRILKKTGSKLYRVYDKDGAEIGVASTKNEAIRKAKSDVMRNAYKQEKVGESIEQRTSRYDLLQKQIPSEGNVPAIKLKTGHLLTFTEPHVLFMENKKIDPRDVQSGGWVVDGDYRSSDRSDTMRWVDKQLASLRVKERRAERMKQNRFQPDEAQDSFLKSEKKAENVRFQPTPEQDAAYINAVKSGDSETAQKMVDEAAKKAAPSKSVILYRGLEKPLDPNYDPNMRDSPSGYSTWTDNPLLARQYAGKNGNIYAIFVPKSEVKADYINSDGDRSFVYATGKKAGLNNVAGKEFLLYEDHDLFSPSQIKSADPFTYDDAGNMIPLSQRFNPGSNDIRFQPDAASPSILNGTNGTRIIKSTSGKFRVYSGTGALLGIRDTQQAAEKLAAKP